MIELFEQELRQPDRHSSKGNQLKWEKNGIWYKADYTGYEGLAEYVTSELLGHSTLADTKMDYPLANDVFDLMHQVQAKTISTDFDEQLDAAEELYGRQIGFHFTRKDVDELVDQAALYTKPERDRVKELLYQQMRKYIYLFS